ncbi:serine/threonine-protein kinase [Paraliomyxa miuraensis]|uniref:serine/threonine-protein kinase n=1 Tax=Paraliomyxa miuraensis TaxID=376150 RepID=UPI00225B8A25|nr:serine/threonine-protein kinase [Paraliomyxa miuraensis]MCX4248127.1 protein kinase [Paraliomyxa miuraensis]
MSASSQPLPVATDSDAASLEGRTVGSGRFEVRSELGRGGMGEVYLAYDRRRRREVALKLIAARYMGRAEREQRFRNEAEYARRVGTHPNVVSVIDVGELADCDGRLFMTMEPVRGPTLAMERVTLRRLPLDQVAMWARQIARGLVAIHAAGIVHRDLTPSNILIQSGTKVAKIFDFGLAGELDAPTSTHGNRLTFLGEVPGTEGYMAPEQALLAIPAETMDVFAFGVVLTEMLVGCSPFAHLDREEYIEWQQKGDREVRSIKRWGMAWPDGLAELVDDCLRRDPKERPQSATDLVERLDQIFPPAVAELVPLPTATKPSEDELDAHTIAEPVSEPSPPEPSPEPRRFWSTVALLSSLTLVIGGMVGWWLATAMVEHEGQTSPPVEEHEGVEEPATPKTTSQVGPSDGEPTGPVEQTAPVEQTTAPVESSETDQASTDPPSEVKPPQPAPEPVAPTTDTDDTEPKKPSDEPKTSNQQASSPSSVSSCEARRRRAHDADRRRAWKKVLAATQDGRCWPEDDERKRLRVRALAETGQYEACGHLAKGSSDPEIQKWRSECEQNVWKP